MSLSLLDRTNEQHVLQALQLLYQVAKLDSNFFFFFFMKNDYLMIILYLTNRKEFIQSENLRRIFLNINDQHLFGSLLCISSSILF